MAAAVQIVYADAQGCTIQWNYDDALLTVQSLSFQVPSTSTALDIEYSVGGSAINQTKQPGTSGNLLLAHSPTLSISTASLSGLPFLKFSGIDFLGAGHATG